MSDLRREVLYFRKVLRREPMTLYIRLATTRENEEITAPLTTSAREYLEENGKIRKGFKIRKRDYNEGNRISNLADELQLLENIANENLKAPAKKPGYTQKGTGSIPQLDGEKSETLAEKPSQATQ